MHSFHLSRNFPLLKPLGTRSNTIVVHASIVLYIEENLKTLLERLNISGSKVTPALSNEVDLDFARMRF